MGGASRADARRVDVEDGIVVRLAVAGEDLLDFGVDLLAGLLDGLLDHPPATVGHHGALEGDVGLQADDDVVVLADVTGGERVDVGGYLGVDIVDAALAFLGEIGGLERVPHPKGFIGRARQKRGVALVGSVVLLDEIPDVDVLGPVPGNKAFPRLGGDVDGCVGFHGSLLLFVGDRDLMDRPIVPPGTPVCLPPKGVRPVTFAPSSPSQGKLGLQRCVTSIQSLSKSQKRTPVPVSQTARAAFPSSPHSGSRIGHNGCGAAGRTGRP